MIISKFGYWLCVAELLVSWTEFLLRKPWWVAEPAFQTGTREEKGFEMVRFGGRTRRKRATKIVSDWGVVVFISNILISFSTCLGALGVRRGPFCVYFPFFSCC
jgi:hypothetical protein